MTSNKKELELLAQLPTLQRIRLLEERVIDLEQTLLEIRNNLILFNLAYTDVTNTNKVL